MKRVSGFLGDGLVCLVDRHIVLHVSSRSAMRWGLYCVRCCPRRWSFKEERAARDVHATSSSSFVSDFYFSSFCEMRPQIFFNALVNLLPTRWEASDSVMVQLAHESVVSICFQTFLITCWITFATTLWDKNSIRNYNC